MVQTIIFDFDGVINDTFEFHITKIQEFSGIRLTAEEYREMHMGNFHDHSMEKMRHVDWFCYRDHIYEDWICLEMKKIIKDTLKDLHKDYALCIVSSNSSRGIADYLKNNQIYHVFGEVIGFEDYLNKTEAFQHVFQKHGTSNDDCVFVTDTLGDVLKAREIGLKTIAVDFGFHDTATLYRGKPDNLISCLSEIPALLSQKNSIKDNAV